MRLTDAQLEKLKWLHDRGGSAYLDKHCRVTAAGESMRQGSWPAWLNLVVKGCIEAKSERFVITDLGKRHLNISVQPHEAGGSHGD